MQSLNKKIAFLSLSVTLGLILSYVEAVLPVFFGVPGMKLGLTNLIIVILLYCMGAKEAYLISIVRVFLAGFLFGNLFSIAFSAAGALFSLVCMALVKRTGAFSLTGVSLIGGVAHNAAQVAVAALLVENVRIGYYFLPLAVAGLVTGTAIGVISTLLVPRLKPVLWRG
jgi:heptaprenyl diphosphate synthase